MISSRHGLGILAVIAVVLLSFVVFGGGGTRGAVDRALVSGVPVEGITALRWEQGGTAALSIAAQGADQPWRFVTPAYGDVDAAALADVVATLRGARWHRRDAARAAGEHARTLVITAGGREHVLAFGRALDGGEQVWIVAGDHALLVDAWVARALDPGELALAIRRPFVAAERQVNVGAGEARIEEGAPPRARSSGGRVIVQPPLAGELRDALAGLELTRLVAAPASVANALELVAGPTGGQLGGACPGAPGEELLVTEVASGCVSAAAAARVRAAAGALARAPVEIADPRLAPVEPLRITLADGGVLDLHKRLLIDGAPADPAHVAELLAVLAAPATVWPRGADLELRGRITIEHAGGTLTLALAPDRQIAREDEDGVVLEVTPAAWAILGRPARELRDLSLWAEDPTTLTRIEIDAVTYQRGAVVGEWTRTPAGSVDARAVEALAESLARPRAVSADAPGFTPRHRVSVTVTPPAGAATQHVLELGPHTPKGCPAKADGAAVVLPRGLCDAVTALAR